MKRIDLLNKRFFRLLVISEYDRRNKQIRWLCLCDCGNETIVFGNNLRRKNHTKSCGCYDIELKKTRKTFLKHGKYNCGSYKSWSAMKRRCNSEKHPAFEKYSKIGYCKEWEIFENFYNDMGDRPNDCTLDRIDGGKGYSKDNCRWATFTQQRLNATNIHIVELNGKKQTIMEWSNELGIKYSTLQMRLNKSKWTDYKSLTTPVRERKVSLN